MTLPLWLIVNFSVATLIALFAVWKGGTPERVAGPFMLAATILTFLLDDRRWIDVQFNVLWLDIGVFVFLTALALKVDRWWPLWAAALQGLCVVIHIAFWSQHRMMSLTYSIGLNIMGYGVFFAVALGTIAHMRRRRLARMAATKP